MKVSIVIPVYNERSTIREILKRVQAVKLRISKEIIVIDDFSRDGTRDILKKLRMPNLKIFYHEMNRGKGAALSTGFNRATGDIVLVQDADLEYDPKEYPSLLAPILDGRADVVYGSRFQGGSHRVMFFWHYVGN